MKSFLLVLSFFICFAAMGQFRFDNVKFKNVYWEELCQTLKSNPDYILVDVRSKGEFYDTSASKSLNIGHLKNAINIDIRELNTRWKELATYKDKPVFLYCSHSQRSRRAAKMLSDSGFVNLFNINGGLSNIRLYNKELPCPLISSEVGYKMVAPTTLTEKSAFKNYHIIDVRPDSSYKSIAVDERKNAMGKFAPSINIPLATLAQSLSQIPKDKSILLVDEFGNESVRGAEVLLNNGYKNVHVLFNGLDAYVTEIKEKDRLNWNNNISYHIINPDGFHELMTKNPNAIVIDVRTKEEFSNTSKEAFRNIGQIKGAINIPYSEIKTALLPGDKNLPIVVYAFSGGNEIFESAKFLSSQGYKNVSVLMGGLFSIRWRAANLKNKTHLATWAVNIPPDNQ